MYSTLTDQRKHVRSMNDSHNDPPVYRDKMSLKYTDAHRKGAIGN